jgi:RIO kinase 1
VDNLNNYFGRFAPELLTKQYGKEIWSLYAHGDLTLETKLTGHFYEDNKPVDLKTVMRVIDNVKKEEEARIRRLAELTKGPS